VYDRLNAIKCYFQASSILSQSNNKRHQVIYMMSSEDARSIPVQDMLALSSEIVASYLTNNAVAPSALPELIRSVHTSLSGLGTTAQPPVPAERPRPAVPISRSVNDDYLVCLEDGKRLKMLKRYLRSKYNLSPDEYRRRWGLPPEYPMVAPAYANRRSEFAKQIGLGRGVRRASGKTSRR
jgi:predicted transcriptional regulator